MNDQVTTPSRPPSGGAMTDGFSDGRESWPLKPATTALTMNEAQEADDRAWLARVTTKHGGDLNGSERLVLRWMAEVDRLRTALSEARDAADDNLGHISRLSAALAAAEVDRHTLRKAATHYLDVDGREPGLESRKHWQWERDIDAAENELYAAARAVPGDRHD